MPRSTPWCATTSRRVGSAEPRCGRRAGLRPPPAQAFCQAFPNPACFRPRISKHFFGGFVGFQWVASLPTFQIQSVPRQIFCPSMGSKSRSRAAPSVGRVEGSSKYASMDRAFQKENSAQLISLRIAVQPPGSRGGPSTSMGVLAHSGATAPDSHPDSPASTIVGVSRRAFACCSPAAEWRGEAGGRRIRGGRGRWLDA